MATPDFILELRRHIGTAPLWLTGVTAVVLREVPAADHDDDADDDDDDDADDAPAVRRQVLLVRRADNGAWTPVTGIVDPGEEPAVAAAREVLEEAAILALPQRLASAVCLVAARRVGEQEAHAKRHAVGFVAAA